MKTSKILNGCLALVLSIPASFAVNANNDYTLCNYTRVMGDPFSAQYVTKVYSGHIQCSATLIGPQGFYELRSQEHK